MMNILKELKPVLEGFVVTMFEGACKTGSPTMRPLQVIGHTVCKSGKSMCIEKKNPDKIGLHHDYNMTCLNSLWECQYFPCKRCISCSKQEQFHMLLLLICHTVPLNDVNCFLKIPIVKERCAHDHYLTPLISSCLFVLKTTLPT